jgi:hypothetical protein
MRRLVWLLLLTITMLQADAIFVRAFALNQLVSSRSFLA